MPRRARRDTGGTLVDSEPGDDGAELQFIALTAEDDAKMRFTALFDHAQTHMPDLMPWWDANRAEYLREYAHLNGDEQRLVDVLEQIRGRE
jgi:hypothetical protein